jgi:hypothetical protein
MIGKTHNLYADKIIWKSLTFYKQAFIPENNSSNTVQDIKLGVVLQKD